MFIDNKDNKCFQYALTIALNFEKENEKLNFFVDKCNLKGIDYPSEKDDSKNFDKNNLEIALNVLYVKSEKIYPAYVWKHN